jgi:hypothetical protein
VKIVDELKQSCSDELKAQSIKKILKYKNQLISSIQRLKNEYNLSKGEDDERRY